MLHVVEVLFTEAGPKLFGQVRSILALLGALMALPQPETRHLCVSLLDVLLSGVVQIPQTEWAGLDALVPQLEEVAANCKAWVSEGVRAKEGRKEDAHILGFTLCALLSRTDAPMAQLAESCRAAIVSRDSRWSRIGSAASAGEAEASTADEPALHRILEQLQDPLLPARAHALMELRRLVLRKACFDI